MRSLSLVLLASALLAVRAGAADLRTFDDAPLHAVQFVDNKEGWAVGDEGAIWHTIDGGREWERQPTGVRSSLRSICFLTPYTGWVAGREELPNGGGSTGVLLYTRDGGLKWHRATLNVMPGLNCIRFRDNKVGFVAGDGTDQYPSGVFQTTDGGRTWEPIAGPRAPTWLVADFSDAQNGALAGAWNRLATFRRDNVHMVDVDSLGGRSVRGLQLQGKRGLAVGDGGLVLLSDDAGATWGICDLKLPTEVLSTLDFNAVHGASKHVWVAGRPGSVMLHSMDQGETWELQRTGQPLPLHGIFFKDETHGWAVGELGTILATRDGGKTWTAQRRGGQRAAVLLLQARGTTVPFDTVAQLGGEDGYLTAALRVVASDFATAAPDRAAEAQRFTTAMRQAGGAAGDMLWQFALPQCQARSEATDVLKAWDKQHAGRAAQDLLQQLVLTLRMWRPNVLVTDQPEVKADECPIDAAVAEAVLEAYKLAGDSKAFPEQITQLGLKPWTPAKLYALCETKDGAHVTLDSQAIGRRLQASAQEFAAPAAALVLDATATLPVQRHYRLLASTLDNAVKHRELMQGIELAFGGEARRDLKPVEDLPPSLRRSIEARRNLQAMAEAPANGVADPNKLVAMIGPTLEGMPDDQAAPAAFALANLFARRGQWELARETFLWLADHYPAHPLTADAYRWLIRHNASSEARRRRELGQFLVLSKLEYQATQTPSDPAAVPLKKGEAPKIPQVNVFTKESREVSFLTDSAQARRWYEGSLQFEPRLEKFGPLLVNDPSVQFCLQSARRNLGDVETAKKWYTQFVAKQPPGPWRDAAQAELWLLARSGAPPKPVAACKHTDTRPMLDGKFDDACWNGNAPLKLKDAVGETMKEYATEARFSYDKDFLYVALDCRHPADKYVAPVKPRTRDANVSPFDHVSILLDLDRDYQTAFRLEVDQRGCVREDCWGDVSWNPRWFVAVQSDNDGWQAEIAIPIVELTGDTPTAGKAWACNVVRTLPGRGVQAWSLPADVTPRLEGMGLLMFTPEARQSAANLPARTMPKAP
jgi:photosystem II stability/assembly factor-like uncharacterized protein/tetratricopeptide (TPR) repeat protein